MALQDNSQYGGYGGAGMMMGAGLGSLLSNWKNPSDAAGPYFNRAYGTLGQYMSPYMNAGNSMLPGLQQEYGALTNNPGGRLNQIGAGYQESPGFKFALQQAMQAGNQGAAAGGMAGSPQNQYQNMQTATGMASQDYNNWMRNALGMYGQGLAGQQGLYDTGARAGIGMGEDLASMMAGQGQLAYEGQNAQNQHDQGGWGAFLGGLGGMIGNRFQ